MARALNDTIVDTESISASTYTSEAFQLLFLGGYSIQAKFDNKVGVTGATAKLQGSNKIMPGFKTEQKPSTDAADWFDICDSSIDIDAKDKFVWNVWSSQYHWVRFIVSVPAGSLDLTAYINGKSEG